MNTVEQLVLFVPVLWLATSVVRDLWAAEIDVVWIVGRIIYAAGYRKDVDKRGPGFMITLLSTAILTAIALWGSFRPSWPSSDNTRVAGQVSAIRRHDPGRIGT